MISFDVVSLFTNVPLKETIDIISDLCVQIKKFVTFLKVETSGLYQKIL